MTHSSAEQQGLPTRAALVLLSVVVCVTTFSATPASAAPRRAAVEITRSAPEQALVGDSVRVHGRVSPAASGTRVRLQRDRGRRWVTVARTRVTGPGDRYAFRVRVRAGRATYRVVSAGDRRRLPGVSRPLRVSGLACDRMSRPAPSAVWFSRPNLRRTSPIALRLGELVCSAAPKATVNVAMYYIRAGESDSDVAPILRSMQRMARFRDLDVRFLVEGKLYRPGSPLRSTLPTLRRIGTVVRCHWGCRSRRLTPAQGGAHSGIQHHKFVTISDMSWAPGRDPVVVSSSANWSDSQLHNRWQSAVMTYDDDELHREFAAQWALMRTCATVGCRDWSTQMERLALDPAEYAVELFDSVWHDVSDPSRERRGDPGRGAGVVFSPWRGPDPLADALEGYNCTGGGSVRVAHMFVTRARERLLDALQGLDLAGCDVRVTLTATSKSTSLEGVSMAKARRLSVRCAPGMHDKFLLVNATRTATGQRERVVWSGSQSLGGNALRVNEEAMLRLSVLDADGAAATAAGRVFDAYARHWRQIRRHPSRCFAPGVTGLSG